MNTYNPKKSNREKGNKGEDIACIFLENKGYSIIERNHLRKWGEIDIIAVKDSILHFVEVKSVTGREEMGYRPEENVNNIKVKKLRRVIQTYLNEKRYGSESQFNFHIIAIRMNPSMDEPKIEFMENIIL